MKKAMWKIDSSTYDPYKKEINMALLDTEARGKMIHIHGLEAVDYPDSEADQQRRINKECAAVLREIADFLDSH